MRTNLTRAAGIVMLLGAIFGLVFSIYGLYALWTIRPEVIAETSRLIDLSNRTLNATGSLLLTLSSSLDQADQNLTLIHTILSDTSGTIGQSTTTVDDTANLMGTNMVQFVKNTQDALSGAQSTAQVIDNTLGAIARLPLIGGALVGGYNPKVPLAQSIQNVNTSLDPMTTSLLKVQSDLKTTSASMATVKGEVDSLAKQVDALNASVRTARSQVMQDQTIVDDSRAELKSFADRMPDLVNTVFMAFTLLLVWIGVSQFGVLLHSAELVTRREDVPRE